jgi:hypothetical protein
MQLFMTLFIILVININLFYYLRIFGLSCNRDATFSPRQAVTCQLFVDVCVNGCEFNAKCFVLNTFK